MPTIPKLKKHTYCKKMPFNRTEEDRKFYNSVQWKNLRKSLMSKKSCDEIMEIENRILMPEELHHVLPYMRGCGDDERWLLLTDEENIVAVTKKTHILIHQNPNGLTDKQKDYLDKVMIKVMRKLNNYRMTGNYE